MPLPKPFKRPSIEISTGEKRAWQWVPPQALAVGDTVADFGTITKIHLYYYPTSSSTIIVDGIENEKPPGYFELSREAGYIKTVYPTDVVFAFCRDYSSGKDDVAKE